MMNIGEIVTLTIVDVSRAGPGVAKHSSGKTVFVAFTMPGDTVEAKITDVKRHFAQAECISFIEQCAQRTSPRCRVFTQCGGCQWQHIPYSLQWQYKLTGIKQVLKASKIRLAGDIAQFPARQCWNYRNRVQLHGFKDKLGFFANRSHDIVAIEQCEIAAQPINAILPQLKSQGRSYTQPYKVEVELTPNQELQTVWNSRHAAKGFRQINDEQNQILKQWIVTRLIQQQPVYDLYGGSANLSLALARQGLEVHCVDTSVPIVKTQNTPATLLFHNSEVLPWLKQRITDIKFQRIEEPRQAFTAIIDPPRGGLGEEFDAIIDRLEQLKVNEIITVGCKTDTWARDLARLLKRGWALQHIGAFDFFPHTIHVETTAHLLRK